MAYRPKGEAAHLKHTANAPTCVKTFLQIRYKLAYLKAIYRKCSPSTNAAIQSRRKYVLWPTIEAVFRVQPTVPDGTCREAEMHIRAQLQTTANNRMSAYWVTTEAALKRHCLYKHPDGRKRIDQLLEIWTDFRKQYVVLQKIFNRAYTPKHTDIIVDYTPVNRRNWPEGTATRHVLEEWSMSLCGNMGEIHCGSGAGSTQCAHDHVVNPYRKGDLKAWQFDHVIERSQIIASILRNIKLLVQQPERLCVLHKQKIVNVTIIEYYLEMFSMKNLRLLYITCHSTTRRNTPSNGGVICAHCAEYKFIKDLLQ